jgi:hypothetical protein
MITGIVQTTRTNDYGYSSYKISSTWYGADSKGPPRASEGEKVTFEAFDKPGKEGKVYPTIKLATFQKVAKTTVTDPSSTGNVNAATGGTAGSAASKPGFASQSGGTRDSYWSDKAAEDAKKDPRIVFQSSYERAILFARLAIDTKCFEALEKAKSTSRLEVLTAFVDEQAARIFKAVYAAEVPKNDAKPAAHAAEIDNDSEESWS